MSSPSPAASTPCLAWLAARLGEAGEPPNARLGRLGRSDRRRLAAWQHATAVARAQTRRSRPSECGSARRGRCSRRCHGTATALRAGAGLDHGGGTIQDRTRHRPRPELNVTRLVSPLARARARNGRPGPALERGGVGHYIRLSRSLGLNPLSRPFDWIFFKDPDGNEKLQLYPNQMQAWRSFDGSTRSGSSVRAARRSAKCSWSRSRRRRRRPRGFRVEIRTTHEPLRPG